jgi:hypothetical protein
MLKKIVISSNSSEVLALFNEIELKKEELRQKAEKRLKERKEAKKP